MPIFEDVLSDEIVLKESFESPHTPTFQYAKRKFTPQKLNIEVISELQHLKSAHLEIILSQTIDVLILGPALRTCGYRDLRELTSMLGQHETQLSATFVMQIQQNWNQLVPLTDGQAVFDFQDDTGETPFLMLDKHYTLIKAQIIQG